MILRFVSTGLDLASVEAESGCKLQVVAASPVQTRVSVELEAGADRQAVTDAMAAAGYAYEGDQQECPLVVLGKDDGLPYEVSIVGGQIRVEPIVP